MPRPLLVLLTAAALAAPAGAMAAPPWSAPATIPAALGSATGADGAAIVAWRACVQGADPVPGATQAVFASLRAAGATAFGGPEQVSDSGENVPTAPFTALDPVSGRSFVAYAPLTGGVRASARP